MTSMRGWICALVLGGGCNAGAKEGGLKALTPPPDPAPQAMRVARLVPWQHGLSQPVGMSYAPGDSRHRLFVVEKTGKIRVIEGGKLADKAFLDVSDKVSGGSEQGLLGLAFHPKFASDPRCFINYTDRKGDTRVVEYKIAGDAADPASARELLYVKQPYANHNGGDLVFGPDGKLYIGLGDGGSGYDPHKNGQNPQVPLGKMLRMDVDAAPPKADIVAIGLRNPWRYVFDRKNGDLYLADVGQDRFEEVDYVAAGQLDGKNFGWAIMEGLHCLQGDTCDQTGLTAPVLEYSHMDGCSITGGYVYRGKALPELDGVYFYADYCKDLLRGLKVAGGKLAASWDFAAAFDPDKKLAKVTTFGEDEDGELYVLLQDGDIYRLVRR